MQVFQKFGAGFKPEKNLFVAASYGEREHFFGLGAESGCQDVEAVDVSTGHENLFARFSQQRSGGRGALRGALGTAYGITAKTDTNLIPFLKAGISLSADRFAGGHAKTTFGEVDMDSSSRNQRADFSLDFNRNDSSGVSLQVGGQWLGDGFEKTEVSAVFAVRF